VTTMMQRLFPSLPAWARSDHPLLRYQLGKREPPSRRVRFFRAFGVILLGLVLLFFGILRATNVFTTSAGAYPVEVINNVLYFPLLTLQLLLSALCILLTANTVAHEERVQHWDSLRATPHGAELTLRTRWASVFYRLRGLIAVIMIGRLILLACMLYDLTAFQGRYIDLLINGVTPEVSVIVAVLLLALQMTATVLLPITGVGFDAALGLSLSTLIRQRTYSALAQILLISGWILFTLVLLTGAEQYIAGQLQTTDIGAWWLTFGASALGDQGLGMIYLGRAGEVWATIPFGIFIGAALLVFAILQAALADGLLSWAARRAQRKG